jgi:hypothetical protein
MVFGHAQQFHSPELPDEVKQQSKIPAEIVPGQHFGLPAPSLLPVSTHNELCLY